MLGRQVKVLEALERTAQFVKTNTPPGANGKYVEHVGQLETVVGDLRADARDQVLGQRMSRAKTQAVRAAIKTLRETHLRPISRIAFALKDEIPGIERATHLPRRRLHVIKLAAEARGVRDNAKRYEQVFVDSGRDPDFIAKLDAAIAEMVERHKEHARAIGFQVGATAGVVQDIRQARRLVTLLDVQVLTGFADDEAKLAEWRSAKRVQAKSGARREEAPIAREEVAAEVAQPRLSVAA
jgi:hypothetical protein